MEIRKVAIIGMGALGVMYGDFLTGKLGKDSVGFVASRERIERYQEEGVFCNGSGAISKWWTKTLQEAQRIF